VQWADYNNDGFQDLLFVGNDGMNSGPHIYLHDMGTYTAVTTSGLPTTWGYRGAWADYDSDGDFDVVVSGYDMQPVAAVYRNDGSNMFTNADAAIDSVDGEAYWVDYDVDGDMDLLLCGTTSMGDSTFLYENIAGTFNRVQTPFVPARFADWADIDADGDPDLVLSGYANAGSITTVYYNNSGTFTQSGYASFYQMDGASAWGDFDNDGDQDLAVTGSDGGTYKVQLYRNDGADSWSMWGSRSAVGNRLGRLQWRRRDRSGVGRLRRKWLQVNRLRK
jgi:hypothetical protein